MKRSIPWILVPAFVAGCLQTAGLSKRDFTPRQPDYAAWQCVTQGMSTARVLELLGSPERVDPGGIIDMWHYGTILPQSDVTPYSLEFELMVGGDSVIGKFDPFGDQFSTNGVPTTPVLIFPYEGLVLSHKPPSVDFRWKPSSGQYPMHYEIKVTPGVNGRTTAPHYATELPIFWAKTQTVHWAVRAVNALGKSAWTEDHSFTFIGKEANKAIDSDKK